MPGISVESPAKLNLHLHIGGRRPDGFHDIESLFLALDFGDALHAETAPRPLSLEICMNLPIPLEKNIVSRAVSLFRERTGYDEGLKITVEKRIPLGGGLGGGSSNAAAALVALSRLAGLSGLPHPAASHPAASRPADSRPEALFEMGASLGSDVPFFLHVAERRAAAAWVSGRGECVRPLALPEPARGLSFVLVNPGFSSDTAEAYRLLDLYREERGGAPASANDERRFYSSFLEWPFFNDFLPVFHASGGAGTAYQQIIASLKNLGAGFAGLSGAGSTCFGVFSEQAIAKAAMEFLLKRWPFVISCELFV